MVGRGRRPKGIRSNGIGTTLCERRTFRVTGGAPLTMLGACSAGPQSGGEPGARPDLLALDVLAGARRVKDDDLAVDLPGVDPDVVDVATIVEEDQVAGAHPALADLAGVLRLLVGRARHVEEIGRAHV